jgi:hypothetical protein
MPLEVQVNFRVFGSIQTTGNLDLRDSQSTVTQGYCYTLPNFIQETLVAYQDPSEFTEYSNLELTGDTLVGVGYLTQLSRVLDTIGTLVQEQVGFTEQGHLHLNHGSSKFEYSVNSLGS